MIMSLDKKIHVLILLIIALFLIISFLIIGDYGITYDEPENFGVGHKYLNYYLTGNLNFTDGYPEIKNHPDFYNFYVKKLPHQHGSVPNILSALTCFIFFQRFKILGPIPAHNIIIPILTAIFIYILFFFVKKYWGNWVGIMSILMLLTYPRFFGECFNNIKDVPLAIASSIYIITFANWHFTKKTKYLYLSFIFFAIALATKIEAVIIPTILFG